jgi:hypothetical protein
MHAQIVLFDGLDPLDVIAPHEVLYAGGAASGGAAERLPASKVTGQRRTILAATEHRP